MASSLSKKHFPALFKLKEHVNPTVLITWLLARKNYKVFLLRPLIAQTRLM